MKKTTRTVTTVAVAITVLGSTTSAVATEAGTAVAGQPSVMASDARVRGASSRLASLINQAGARSRTFFGLVERISSTDGIVYVKEGQCGVRVRACLLLTMTLMGPNRVLWVHVDPGQEDRDLMASIAHELQHAVEVLGHSYIRSDRAMILLYQKEGHKSSRRFETEAAVRAGIAVRAELQKSAAAGVENDASPDRIVSSLVRTRAR